MKNYMQLGTAPPDEVCAQLGQPNYREYAMIEATTHIAQLQRCFRQLPDGMRFGIEYIPHDFGVYTDVVLHYNSLNEKHCEVSGKIEDKQPRVWDTKANDTLRELREYERSDEAIATTYSNESMDLREAIDKIEQAGGVVLLDEEPDEPIVDFTEDGKVIEKKKETTLISLEQALSMHGYTDDDLQDLMFDSIVPACCRFGCEVEPDGICSHGNESVLLAMGVI